MDILIETATGNEVSRWPLPPPRIPIPNSNDVVFPGGDVRPMGIGPDHFLSTAIEVVEDIGEDQKRGPETVDVAGQVVTITQTSVNKESEDYLNTWKAAMSVTDKEMPRWFEDVVTEGSVVLQPGRVKDNYDSKVALRGTKP